MEPKDEQEYLRVVEKIQSAMHGEDIDKLVPALATCLAQVGAEFAPNKQRFVAYVVNTIDNLYDRCRKGMSDGKSH